MQTQKMIRFAATPADERRKKIDKAAVNMDLSNDPVARDFSVSFDSRMTRVMGRVLPAPSLVYGRGEVDVAVPTDGTWNMVNKKFVDAKPMNNWGIINVSYGVDDDKIHFFAEKLAAAAKGMGMLVPTYHFIEHCDRPELATFMKDVKRQFPNLQILFVIIDKKGDPAYGTISTTLTPIDGSLLN